MIELTFELIGNRICGVHLWKQNPKHMTKQTASEIVIALLHGCEVDGETMQDIIERVGMVRQMLTQLVMHADVEDLENAIENRENDCPVYQRVFKSAPKTAPKIDADALADKIADETLYDIDSDEIEDYDLSMTGKEIELTSVSLDNSVMKRKIKAAIEEFIDNLQEEEA